MSLSKLAQDQIDRSMLKFPENQKQSAVMEALTIVQKENQGFLSIELMDLVADYLGLPKIAVYEVASFYSMYEHQPVGKHKICICTNISCMLCGSGKIVDYLKSKLNVGYGEITKDGKFSLKEVECLAACGGAPAMMIGDQYYENLTTEKVDQILENLD